MGVRFSGIVSSPKKASVFSLLFRCARNPDEGHELRPRCSPDDGPNLQKFKIGIVVVGAILAWALGQSSPWLLVIGGGE